MSSLKTESEEFITWYLNNLINNRRTVGSHFDDSLVFLPYCGLDEETTIHLFKFYVKIRYPEFEIDDSNIGIIELLAKISARKCSKRGLIIRGTVGVGKTTLLRYWLDFRSKVLANGSNSKVIESGKKEKEFKMLIYDPTSLIARFMKKGHSIFFDEGQICFVDDMGLATTVNHFGTITNILEELIYSQYVKFKEDPAFEFYGTTNLASGNLQNIIGERAMSRLLEMASWNEGLLQGGDRRKTASQSNEWPKLAYPNQSNGQSYPDYDPI